MRYLFFPIETSASASVPGTQLAAIPAGQASATCLGIQLWPTPTTVITYALDYVRKIPEVVAGPDEPLLPEDFHWLLVEGALIKEWTKKDDSRRMAALQDYDGGLRSLRSWVNSNQDTVASLRRIPQRISLLGPNYPSGS